MSEGDFFRFLIATLERCGIPYMVTGSVASSFHGEPRTSLDVDIVIDGSADQIDHLVESIAERCYVSEAAAVQALAARGMFNIIDSQSGIKADLIFRKDRPFSVEEFNRRRIETISGVRAFMVSPEDSILSKLEWASMSGSERQYIDSLKIALRDRQTLLDLEYMRHWAKELNVSSALARLIQEGELE